jgi:hypothetical protein
MLPVGLIGFMLPKKLEEGFMRIRLKTSWAYAKSPQTMHRHGPFWFQDKSVKDCRVGIQLCNAFLQDTAYFAIKLTFHCTKL